MRPHNRARLLCVPAIMLACSGAAASAELARQPEPGASQRSAPEGAAERLKLTTERCAVFKDGYALFVKRAEAVADARGRVYTDEVPDAAVLGCFWAVSESGAIAAMRAEFITEEADESRDEVCTSLLELLRANMGRRVTLILRDETRTSIEGSLERILESEPEPPALPIGREPSDPQPAAAGTVRTPLTRRGGEFVVMQTATGRLVMPVGEIRAVQAPELATTTTRRDRVTRTTKRLSFDLGPSAAGKPASLRIMYFAPGLRWIPTYRLAVNADNRSGVLALQGELLNEAENLTAVPTDLVVGVPNFRFRETVSPLVLERTLRNALLAAAPDIMGAGQSQYSNALFAQRAGEWSGRADDSGGVAGANLAPELGAGAEQDLFVYSRPAMELSRGDRATVPILTQDVTFDHLYTLDIGAVRDPQRSGAAQYACKAPGGRSPLPPPSGESPASRFSINNIWHQIELTNSSAAPWTTGAALVMGGGASGAGSIPIAQELLRYTPAGGKVLLPLTIAVDLKADLVEEELSRQENALKRNSTSYTLVKARSTITLTSSRKEPSATRITLGFGGRVTEASDSAKVAISGHSSEDWGNNDPGPVNNHSHVTWELNLAPGEKKVLTVEFTYYCY